MRAPLPGTTVCLRLFTQDVVFFQRHELPRAALHRFVAGEYLVLLVVLAVFSLGGALQPMSNLTAVALQGVKLITTMGVCLGLVYLLEQRHDGKRPLQVPASAILIVATLVAAVIGQALMVIWLGLPKLPLGRMFMLWLFQYFVAEVFVCLVMYLVMPRVLSDLRGVEIRSVAESYRFGTQTIQPEAAPPPEAAEHGQWSEIGGQRIALSDLRHIEAEGNYIRVTTTQKRLYLPGPFGPVAESLPPELGMQISRSDWVARAAVAGVLRAGGELRLQLTVGGEVTVPRNRHKVVLAWLEEEAQRATPRSSRRERNIDPDGAVM